MWYGTGGDLKNVRAVCAVRAVPATIKCISGSSAGSANREWGTVPHDTWW